MRFLIVDEFHPSIFGMLENEGWEYEYLPDLSRDEIREVLPGFDAFLTRSKTAVDGDLIEKAHDLKLVARAGSGVENIDATALKEKDIELFSAPEGNRDAVGDHTVGLILAMTKNIARSSYEVKEEKNWGREANRGIELSSQTVGIIGYGNTGSATAKRLSSFGCEILAYDKYRENYAGEGINEASLDQIFEKSTIVSLHIPLTAETKGMFDEEFISNFSQNFYLINTSRGEILDTKALVKGLKSGKILGASLDVLENEKIDQLTQEQSENFEFLRKSKNTIITPHIGGWSHESHIRINQVLVDKISEWEKKNL